MAQGPQEWSQTGNMHTQGRPVAVRTAAVAVAVPKCPLANGTGPLSPLEELPLRISQGTVKSGGGSSAAAPKSIWCQHSCRLGKTGCKAVASQTTPALGFHPPPPHTRSLPSSQIQHRDGGRLQPWGGRKMGEQGFVLASGRRVWVEKRMGSE